MKKQCYKVGDYVFYPGAGVGQIASEEQIYLTHGWETCYVIRICDNPLTIKVPVGNMMVSGVRPLVSCQHVRELLKVLSGKSGARTASNWTEHYKELERKVHAGSCLEIGEVVRDLMRLKGRHGLSFEEARLLETASAHLSTELAQVEGIPRAAAIERIRTHVTAEC